MSGLCHGFYEYRDTLSHDLSRMSPPTPKNPKLYAEVKREADGKFLAPTSAYKSGWIVREYKKRGGTYEEAPNKKTKKPSGLTRWFMEKWVDINRGNKPCGRPKASDKGVYPLCRPSKRITIETPVTVNELKPSQIKRANKAKQAVKSKGRIKSF